MAFQNIDITDALCRNVTDTRFNDIDEAVIENAKCRVIDVLGCATAGADAECNPELVNLIREWGGKPEASILIHGNKTVAHNAALVNSVMARSFDFESLGPLVDGRSYPAHISGTTVITAVTMAETHGISGKELLTALISGDNLTARIIAAESTGGLPPGWDSVGTTNSFGAAAIAARIMGLTAKQIKNSLGLVFNQMSGSMQNIWDGVPAFKLLQGLSSRNGIISAELAKAGWAGPDDPLFGKLGYFNLFAGGCGNPEILTKELGKKYYCDAHFKLYPCCAVSHAAVDCALYLANHYNLDYRKIKEAVLYVSRSGLNSFLSQPLDVGDFPHAGSAFNYKYHMATVLMNKSIKPEHFERRYVHSPEAINFMKKIRLEQLPGVERELLCAKIRVTMNSGEQYEKLIESPKGDPLGNPLTKDDIFNKFLSNLEFSKKIDSLKGKKLISLLDRLEELENINEVINLLT
ncbi:MAG: MmgE/PrpD family protein [Desulfatiglans sp.]|nr:MmgE/PrpD family protein [Desulfatiglans sp.]